MLFGDDEQCEAEAVENRQYLVQAYTTLTVFEPRHQIDRYAEKSCRVIDTQLLGAASLTYERTQGIRGGEESRHSVERSFGDSEMTPSIAL